MAVSAVLHKHPRRRAGVVSVVDETLTVASRLLDEKLPSQSILLGHQRPPLELLWLPSIYLPFFAAITTLELQANALTSLPSAIYSLGCLTELNISGNRLSSLSHAIGKLSKLRELHASDNALTELPASLGLCSELAVLDCSVNKLCSVPGELAELSNLRRLWLDGNCFGDALQSQLLRPFSVPSLRNICLQACARHTRNTDWHVYCRHDAYFRPSARVFRQLLAGLMDAVRHLPKTRVLELIQGVLANAEEDIAWSSFISDELESDNMLFSGLGTEHTIAKLVCSVDCTSTDTASSTDEEGNFAEEVWQETLRWILSRLQRRKDLYDSLHNCTTESVVQTTDQPLQQMPSGAQVEHQQPIGLTLNTKFSENVPGLPIPTSRSALVSPLFYSPLSPDSAFSTPSPPSAYECYCTLQVVPADLVLRMLIPIRLHCAFCEGTIHFDGLFVRKVTSICGELVPSVWWVCSVGCRRNLAAQLSMKQTDRKIRRQQARERISTDDYVNDPVQMILRSRSKSL